MVREWDVYCCNDGIVAIINIIKFDGILQMTVLRYGRRQDHSLKENNQENKRPCTIETIIILGY